MEMVGAFLASFTLLLLIGSYSQPLFHFILLFFCQDKNKREVAQSFKPLRHASALISQDINKEFIGLFSSQLDWIRDLCFRNLSEELIPFILFETIAESPH